MATESRSDPFLGIALIVAAVSFNRPALCEIASDGHVGWPIAIGAFQALVILMGLWVSLRGMPFRLPRVLRLMGAVGALGLAAALVPANLRAVGWLETRRPVLSDIRSERLFPNDLNLQGDPDFRAVPRSTSATTGSADGNASKFEFTEADSPWWRGATQDGHYDEAVAPNRWGPEENVAWSAPLPGFGHASPVVVGHRVFIFTADEETEQVMLLCLHRDSGQEMWRHTIHEEGFMFRHGKNSHASATPACDGTRVFVATINSGALVVTAIDFDGTRLWQKPVGKFTSTWGYGSSPCLAGPFVVVNGEQSKASFVAALDRITGEIAWREPRPDGQNGSYGTPVAAEVAGKMQLLLAGPEVIMSHDPMTGKVIWSCRTSATQFANTIAFSNDMVFASGALGTPEIVCIKADGVGDVSDTHVRWRTRRGTAYVSSPIYHAGRLYVVRNSGVVTCFDTSDGSKVWGGRLDGEFSASPVKIGASLFVPNEEGDTIELAVGDEFKILGQYKLGRGGFASLVPSGDRLLIRSLDRLYCIATGSR